MDDTYELPNISPASTTLPRFDHLLTFISASQWTEKFCDLRIFCKNGAINTHRMVLASISPFVKEILEDRDEFNSDEAPSILLPDIKKEDMIFLLSILYNGSLNIYKSELTSLIELTKLLKMSSFPVIMLEQNWKHRFPSQALLQETGKSFTKSIVAPATITPLPPLSKIAQTPKILRSILFRKSDVKETKSVVAEKTREVPKSDLNTLLEKQKQKEGTYSILLPRETRKQKLEAQADPSMKITASNDFKQNNSSKNRFESNELHVKKISNLSLEIPIAKQSKKSIAILESKKAKISLLQSNNRIKTDQTNVERNMNQLSNKIVGSTNRIDRPEKNMIVDNDATITRSAETAKAVRQQKVNLSGHIRVEKCDRTGKLTDIRQIRNDKTEEVTVEIEDINSTEGLGNLLSVAEAFEKSQKPDFNDVLNPILRGTDTEKVLVRSCVICKKQLLGRNAYGRHMKNVHSKIFGPYTCPQCDKQFESGYMLMQHMYVHVGPRGRAAAQGTKYQCLRCPSTYTTSSRLNDHMKKKHGVDIVMSESKFICNVQNKEHEIASCNGQRFKTAKKFMFHMNKIHNLKPWLCEICEKRFKERQNYQYHMMTNHESGTKTFICDICEVPKVFKNPRQLYTHRSLHLGRRFLCSQCGYKARSSANLRGHIKSKHEGKSFECKVCQKRFGSGNNLKNHIRIHTGESPFECELCKVKFKRLHHLHSHIESKIHTDIMENFRSQGYEVPEHLDPLTRKRGKQGLVEDGPVTLANGSVDPRAIKIPNIMFDARQEYPSKECSIKKDSNTTGAVHFANANDLIVSQPSPLEGQPIEIKNVSVQYDQNMEVAAGSRNIPEEQHLNRNIIYIKDTPLICNTTTAYILPKNDHV